MGIFFSNIDIFFGVGFKKKKLWGIFCSKQRTFFMGKSFVFKLQTLKKLLLN